MQRVWFIFESNELIVNDLTKSRSIYRIFEFPQSHLLEGEGEGEGEGKGGQEDIS